MTTPRALLVDTSRPGYYHLVSRCVRRAWLCGRHDDQDYTHRKQWLDERLNRLAKIFPISIYAKAIMSNHFHLVVYIDPGAVARWSAEEVVDRWLRACPPTNAQGQIDDVALQVRTLMLMADTTSVDKLRSKLSSLSVFMKLLKQPVARRANLEDGCLGHFFEKRFYSGALLDLNAVVAAMAYVDLNPIRAQMATRLQDCEHTSIAERLTDAVTLDAPLTPMVTGLDDAPVIPLSLGEYVDRLTALIPDSSTQRSKGSRWQRNVALFRSPQRAYGSVQALTQWVFTRGLQLREVSLT